MFFSRFVENLALALISRYPLPGFADAVIVFLNPIYEFFQRLGV